MNFYVVLGQSNHPIANQLFTEHDVEEMRKLPQAAQWSFVPIQVPWEQVQWSKEGGYGKAAFPGEKQTTMRVPKRLAYAVKKYAVWLNAVTR
jgi:hypothetical protein